MYPLFQVSFSTMLHMRVVSSCFATDLVFRLIFLHLGGRLSLRLQSYTSFWAPLLMEDMKGLTIQKEGWRRGG
jgi:hypothetical protein